MDLVGLDWTRASNTVKKMYSVLKKRNVGMNIIESESMIMVRERVSGPTWHRLIDNDRGDEGDKMMEMNDTTEKSKCWRDPEMIRKLTTVRVKVMLKQIKKAKDVFKREMSVGINWGQV